MLQHGGGDGGMFAAEAEMRLDFFFPGIDVVLHLAGKDLAELRVDAADIGREGFDKGREEKG